MADGRQLKLAHRWVPMDSIHPSLPQAVWASEDQNFFRHSGFDLEAMYTIATNDFICAGGDTYYVFSEAAQSSMTGIGYLVSDALRYFLAEACGGVVPEGYREPQGRIEVVV